MKDEQSPAFKMFFWMCMKHVLVHLGAIPGDGASLFAGLQQGDQFVINQGDYFPNFISSDNTGPEKGYIPQEEVLRILSTRDGWNGIENVMFHSNFTGGCIVSKMRDFLSFRDEVLTHFVHDKVLAFATGLSCPRATFPVSCDVFSMIGAYALQNAPDPEVFRWISWTKHVH